MHYCSGTLKRYSTWTDLIVYPEHDLVAVAQELHQHERLLQLHALLGEPRQQQLPQAVQLVQPPADRVRSEMARGYHVAARVVQHHDRVRVGGHFGFERLVLLDLGLVTCLNLIYQHMLRSSKTLIYAYYSLSTSKSTISPFTQP